MGLATLFGVLFGFYFCPIFPIFLFVFYFLIFPFFSHKIGKKENNRKKKDPK